MHLASNNVNNWQAYTAATHPNNVTRLDTQGEKCTWPANSRIVQVEVASLCGIAFGAANRNDSSARWLHTYRLVGEAVEQ